MAAYSSPMPPCVNQETNGTSSEVIPIDSLSKKGKFGWAAFGDIFIPYILRGNEKYCAVKMVENKLLSKFANRLDEHILSCAQIKSVFVTTTEAKLLREINIKHCERMFGCIWFGSNDLLVMLSDVTELYDFVQFCNNKLLAECSNIKKPCGLVKMNNNDIFPYIELDGKKYIPLFYFKDKYQLLLKKSIILKSWHITYLKLCCKVIGKDDSYLSCENCHAISIEYLEEHCQLKAVNDECWPSVKALSNIFNKKGDISHTNRRLCIKLPSSNPSSPKILHPTTKSIEVAHSKNSEQFVTQQNDSGRTFINGNVVSTENFPPKNTSISRKRKCSETANSLPDPSSEKNIIWEKLIPILDAPRYSKPPFITRKYLDGDKSVFCISSGLKIFPEPLVTVNDFINDICPNLTVEGCKDLLQNVLKVNLYTGNKGMMALLWNHKKIKSENEVVPFILLQDIIKFLPKLQSCENENCDKQPTKRPRIN